MENLTERTKQLKSDIETFLKDFDIKELNIKAEPKHTTPDGKPFSHKIQIEFKL